MKIIIPGGTGHIGAALIRHFSHGFDEVVVLSRQRAEIPNVKVVQWDGCTLGDWVEELEDSDVVINLAGRTVNCRYNAKNLAEMMRSRVESTQILGEAIGMCMTPPKLWLQSSTATIYAHRFDAPNDEATGIISGEEPGAPPKWVASIEIAKAWEKAFFESDTPQTRKVAMRSSMVMSVDKGSVFDVLRGLVLKGLGGRLGSGKQYVSWIHEQDFCRAISFLIDSDLSGAVNVCSPNPLPQAEFMHEFRTACEVNFGLSAATWMVELGCWAMRTESELVLKSRRVVPGRLLDAGFDFEYPVWRSAVRELVGRAKTEN
ncbi:MAG: DUF1731 domain-containing protein [Fimbriimonadaceae bacterium]|nr:DUF1731 domain-containing protein [Fimbriimonadaceae bacterium]